SVLISLQYLLAYFSTRSTKFSRLLSSEPTLVFYKGSFLQTALRKERVTEDEVRSVLRSKGVTSIELVEAVVMEANGQFTVVEQGSLHNDDSPLSNVRRIDERIEPKPTLLFEAAGYKQSPIFRLSFVCELTGTKLELFFGRFEAFEPIERKSTPKRYQGTFL